MSETIYSTDGSNQTARRGPRIRVRIFGLALAFLASAALAWWVSAVIWKRVDNLQHEFTRLHADSFYFGVRMQSGIRRLNDTLLRYRLDGNPQVRESFRAESLELRQWLDSYTTNASLPLEREFAERIGTAYDQYLRESARTMEETKSGFLGIIPKSKASMFPDSYQQVQIYSETLLSLCNNFIKEQRASFDAFLQRSNATLDTFQRLFRMSVGLVLVLATVLALLAYRGMIAPLRHQLIESHATIARQEKLASLGTLAAGVAHEIRNPLTAIRFRLFSLRKAKRGSESESEDLSVIVGELDRLERIVQDFLRFARPSEPELVSLPAQRLLQEVFELMKPQLAKKQIELRLEETEPLWVKADTQQIKQVTINLVQNAAESIEQHGKITLRVRMDRAPARDQHGLVALEVSDTGKGIPEDVMKRLFDPFFTTKEGGTGLGLPIAARIVEKHGGAIRCQTNPEGGATFGVILPYTDEHETPHSAD